MKDITKEMLIEYNLSDYDFMGYRLEEPQFNHIEKKSLGGRQTKDNGAF